MPWKECSAVPTLLTTPAGQSRRLKPATRVWWAVPTLHKFSPE
jgi:hypothetical protein